MVPDVLCPWLIHRLCRILPILGETKMNTAQLLAKRADHKTAHVLHLLLSVLTAGLWVPVWVLVAVSHAMERARIDRMLAGGKGDQNILQAVGLMKK